MMRKHFLSRMLILGLMLFVVYSTGYGLARWRKLLTRHEYYSGGEKTGLMVYDIKAGHDMRTAGVGALKNRIAPPMEVLYTPLCMIEAGFWNLRER